MAQKLLKGIFTIAFIFAAAALWGMVATMLQASGTVVMLGAIVIGLGILIYMYRENSN